MVVITEPHVHVDASALEGKERDTLCLTWDERRWTRKRIVTTLGREVALALPLLDSTGVVCDYVFLDPPYDRESEYSQALELLGEQPPELVIVQHSVRLVLAESYGNLGRIRILKQGDNTLSLYAKL